MTGFGDAGKCTRFPIVIGRDGSAYTDAVDKQWHDDFAEYASGQGEWQPGGGRRHATSNHQQQPSHVEQTPHARLLASHLYMLSHCVERGDAEWSRA